MGIANILYDRPYLDQQTGSLALYLSGSFIRAIPSKPYEGRIQINNAIGASKVDLLEGDLPGGYSVTIDQATQEVVIAWPAYVDGDVLPITNADFENGSAGWILGYGWSVEAKGAQSNVTSGTKAAALRGNGAAWIEQAAFYPIGNAQSVTGSVQIQQGGSSKNNVIAAAGMRFYDINKQFISGELANIVNSGSDGEWKGSGKTWSFPAGTAYVRPGIWGLRKRQNRPLYADDLTWDLAGAPVGVNTTVDYPITLRVTDSAGRIVDWVGTIHVLPYLYTFVYGDSIYSTDTTFGRLANPRLDTQNDLVLAVSDHYFYSSPEGKTWTPTPTQFPTYGQGRGIAATSTAWFGLGNNASNYSILYRTTDQGSTWSEILYAGSSMTWVDQIAYYGDTILAMSGFYAASDGAMLVVSQDNGDTWQKVSVPSGWNPGDSLIPMTALYIPSWDQWIIPGQGKIYTANGIVPTQPVEAVPSTARVGACAYSPDLDMIVVAGDTQIWIKQGVNGSWQNVGSPPAGASYIFELLWHPILKTFVGNRVGILCISEDGINWYNQAFTVEGGAGSGDGNNGCIYIPWTHQMLLCHANSSNDNRTMVSDL